MEKTKIRILLVEDSLTDARLLHQVFLHTDEETWQMTHVEELSEAIAICQASSTVTSEANCQTRNLKQHKFDVVLLDLHLPDSTGLDTLKEYQAAISYVPVIVLTELDDEQLALQALAQGAQDYLVKDQITIQRLVHAIRYAIERQEILNKIRESEECSRQTLARQQDVNELKSDFVAMVSHEFRNPLTMLKTALEILESSNDKYLQERSSKYFERMHNAINQMLQLLDEVLFLSKSDAKKLDFNPYVLHLENFCLELLEVLKIGVCSKHNIIFNTKGDCSYAKMDENLINCILTNLISNAVKYSLENSNIYFDVICQDNIAIFKIKDEGRGIPLKDQPNLFQTFYRASNVGKVQGTGLGLAIVKKCVEIHRGEIFIESQPDMGTTVIVTLPLYSMEF